MGQLSILNLIPDSIPANFCLLDIDGNIFSVNRAWKNFADQNDLVHHDYCLGENYIKVCESSNNATAKKAAKGIRDLLNGKIEGFSLDYPCHSPDEKRWFHMMAAPLFQDKIKGAAIIHINITQRKIAESKLEESRQELRALTKHLESVIEEERIRIAREIHDDLGQSLIAIKMMLFGLQKSLPNNNVLKDKANTIIEFIGKAIIGVSKITTQLRPEILDTLGLIAAIEWQSEELQKNTGVIIDVNSSIKIKDFSLNATNVIFRIYQEAVTNALKHSKATSIKVDFRCSKSNFIMTIRDNGVGISKTMSKQNTGLGIIGMKERAIIIGGLLSIKELKDKGTQLKLSIPLGNLI